MPNPEETTKKGAEPALVVLGCGYVGSVVAVEAASSGRKVVALTRNPERAEALRAAGVHVVEARLESDDWHSGIDPAGADIVNTVSAGGGGVIGYALSYVRGFDSIRRWAAQGPARCLVYTSSTSVYGPGAVGEVTEDRPPRPQGAAGELLVLAEKTVSAGLGASWQAGYILRLAGIYGPGRHHILDQVRLGTGSVAGTAETTLNLIHRDDAAAAIQTCLRAGRGTSGGLFNVADDGRATRGELVAWLAEQLGQSLPGFTGEPAPGRRALTPNRVICNHRIKAALGWSPRYPTFREGYVDILKSLPIGGSTP